MYLYHYPDIWYDYATWHTQNGSVDSASKVFQRALKALPGLISSLLPILIMIAKLIPFTKMIKDYLIWMLSIFQFPNAITKSMKGSMVIPILAL
jgi:hypothetical protein